MCIRDRQYIVGAGRGVALGSRIACRIIPISCKPVLQVARRYAQVLELRAGIVNHIHALGQLRDQVRNARGLRGGRVVQQCGQAREHGLVVLRQRTDLRGQRFLFLVERLDLSV